MKFFTFVAFVALSTLTSSFALTAADIAPGALAGKSPTFTIVNGIGNYEVSIQDLFGVSLNGTFTLGAAPPQTPEISVQQPLGKELTDGVSKKSFGFVQVSLTSILKRFTIKNTGKARLTGLGISITGANKTNFIVGSLAKTSLLPNETVSFTVQFKPTAFGTRTASIHIKSNDADENPFDIQVSGVGVGIK